jgi:hypothetical protein
MIMNKCPFKTFTIGSLTAVIVLHLFEKHYMKSRLLLKSTFHIYWRCLLIRFSGIVWLHYRNFQSIYKEFRKRKFYTAENLLLEHSRYNLCFSL